MRIDFIDLCIIFVTITLSLFITNLLTDNITSIFLCGFCANTLSSTLIINKHLYEKVDKIAE